jgi:hypothetical protein
MNAEDYEFIGVLVESLFSCVVLDDKKEYTHLSKLNDKELIVLAQCIN